MKHRIYGPVVCAVLCAGAVLPAAPASAAAPAYIAIVNSLYVPGDVKILAGSTLTLVNGETIAHDVISSDYENGLPLFQSRLTAGVGDNAVVTGVENLPVGLWPFYCSLHEAMRGTIEVLPA